MRQGLDLKPSQKFIRESENFITSFAVDPDCPDWAIYFFILCFFNGVLSSYSQSLEENGCDSGCSF